MGMPTMRWAAAAVAGLALAACGTQQAVTTSSATQPASPAVPHTVPLRPARAGGGLCSHVPAVTRLVVTRVVALPQNHLHFAIPAGVTISDPATARGVAQAVCGLPAAPHGVMSCPADLGVSYRLSFAAARAAFPVVTVSAGGCGGVTGAGLARRATSATFWTELARALGVPHPSSSALQGTS
jgi:hypothetical protein